MRSYVDRVLSAFEVNLVAIAVAIITSCILFLPAQFREIYRTFAQRVAYLTTLLATLPSENWFSWDYWWSVPQLWNTMAVSTFTVIALLFLSILIWLACRSNPQQSGDVASKAVAATHRIFSLVLAILPILALALGLYLASMTSDDVDKIKTLLASIKEFQLQQGLDPIAAKETAAAWAAQQASFNTILIASAAVVGLGGVLFGVILSALENSARANAVGRFMLSGPVALAASVTFLALCVVFSIESWPAAMRISAVPILCVFAVLSLLVVNYLTVRSGALGRLVAWCFAAAVIVFSILELNNNHHIRRTPLPDSAQASSTAPNLSDAFPAWYNARTDRSRFPEKYPIYIVAAQGGGIYAAYQAAAFLSSVQARCPNFAHHLFAISSVSGGSVGAAIFAGLMKEAEQGGVKIPDLGCNDTQAMDTLPQELTFVDEVESVLKADFWSPLQAKALFPDLLQWFMPVWIERFDRARALEHALETSWHGARATSTMAESFGSLWPKGFGQSLFTPALILNTTEVDTGRRRLISPFEFKGLVDLKFVSINCASGRSGPTPKNSVESIPLSTAAVLSARFPWVTPTGWFYERAETPGAARRAAGLEDCVPDKRVVTKLSDGGYFEDSGVATALDLISSLQEVIASHELKVDLKLIILTSSGFTTLKGSGLDEAMDPIRTMLNARGARAYIEVGRAERIAASMQAEPPMKVTVDGLGYPLPLGWSLSDLTRLVMLYQVGGISPCERQRESKLAEQVHSGSCNIETIVKQLTYQTKQ